MADTNTFLVSVANALVLDPTTRQGIAYGKANISSSFELSMANTDVRGGINNALLYKYMHDRDLMVNIEQAIFAKTYLGLNVGSSVLNSTVNVVNTECIQLTGDAGVLTETPIGTVTVFKADGTVAYVTPVGKNITVPSGGATIVTAVYSYSDTVDRVSISTTKPPSVVTIILTAEVRNSAGTLVELLQIEVPRVQIDGNYTLSLSADGVSTESLKGNALKVDGTSCTDGDIYAYVSWIPVSSYTVPVAFIASTPNEISVSAAGTLPATQQITVYGVRGGIYSNVVLTSGLTFTKRAGGAASITVNSTGLVTVAGGATAGQTAIIDVVYNDGTTSYPDTVNVTVVA